MTARLVRVEVAEARQPPLPALHLAAPFVIGSSLTARVRLPSSVAQAEHVKIEADGRWRAFAAIDGDSTEGVIGEGVTLAIGSYRVAIAPAAADAVATPPQRTESLARELMRNLLGTAGAPTLEIERGPLAGAKRLLAPPESTLVIGRGDEANWIIADDDLSRAHAEVRRTWDGVVIADLDSKNGTHVAGRRIDRATPLRDGARIELGKLALVFHDPAEKRLARLDPSPRESEPAGETASDTRSGANNGPIAHTDTKERPSESARAGGATARRTPASPLPFYAAIAIMLLALGGLVWVLSS